MAFDQQQQDLIDAASKALSYRQDIIEENIRLTYALQTAQQERSTFISSLLPLLSEYDSLHPSVPDAQSIVSNLKVLFKHLQEQLLVTENFEVALFANLDGAGEIKGVTSKSSLDIVPQTAYPQVQSPMSSPVQARGEWGVLGNKNHQFIPVITCIALLQFLHPLVIAHKWSDLGAVTQALLNRGARLTEVPKQPQFESLPVEKQSVVIYAAVNDFCDLMPLDNISQYEKDILSTINPELPKSFLEIRVPLCFVSSRNQFRMDVPARVPPHDSRAVQFDLTQSHNPPFKGLSGTANISDGSENAETQNALESSAPWVPGVSTNLASGLEDANPSYPYLPTVLEEPGSSFSEAAEDDPLPGIYGLQITGEPFPGRELQASGYPTNGTTTCNFEGDFIKVYANEQRKITCDPETKELIKRTLEIGHVTYEIQVQLPQVRFLDMWEPAVLAIKREGYSIKCNGQRGVVITEKFQQATVVCLYSSEISIPSGSLSEFSITSADGVDYDLKPAENTLLRDTIVLVLRLFKNMTALISYGFHDIWCTLSQKLLLSLIH
ncbi:hypothetical protein PR202_gb26698 [Eleusine coracana subsp. coracana]|uniref:Uncharacterized protein n=1 Tax=Eleusine coracana subsp. coracana TaxID=191504 RepID=A0AAV5FSH2_ELECO|nr:hypothetical protein PR202_gb26698 [Eleusine coracana subsp. coracana]